MALGIPITTPTLQRHSQQLYIDIRWLCPKDTLLTQTVTSHRLDFKNFCWGNDKNVSSNPKESAFWKQEIKSPPPRFSLQFWDPPSALVSRVLYLLDSVCSWTLQIPKCEEQEDVMDGGRFCAQILQVLKMPEDQKMANSCHQRVRVWMFVYT